jgi:hypothetical protein
MLETRKNTFRKIRSGGKNNLQEAKTATRQAKNSRREARTEVGKVTFKINGDEALSNESIFKSNGDKALNDDFLKN